MLVHTYNLDKTSYFVHHLVDAIAYGISNSRNSGKSTE